jgi:hypothetical protein
MGSRGGGWGLGVDVALLQQVTGINEEPPVERGIDRDTTAWHLRLGPAVRHVTASERATAAYLGHAAGRPGRG